MTWFDRYWWALALVLLVVMFYLIMDLASLRLTEYQNLIGYRLA